MKDKNHMLNTLDAEKTFDKNSTLLHDKRPGKISDTRNKLKYNTGSLQKAHSLYQLKCRENQINSTKMKTRQCCPLSPYLCSINLN